MGDPRLRELATRVRLRYEPAVPAQCTTVRVHLADGRVLTAAADSAVLPAPAERREIVRRKFDELVGPGRGSGPAAALRDAIIDLPTGRSDHRALRGALSIHQ